MRALATLGLLMAALPGLGLAALKPQNAIDYTQFREVQISPDGRHAAVQVEAAPKGDHAPENVWLLDLRSADLAPVSADGASRQARWSPDGRLIAYLSAAAGPAQIQAVPAANTAAAPTLLTHHTTGISAFEWSPDGRQIAFLARDGRNAAQSASTAGIAGDDAREVRIVSGSDMPTRVWILDVASGTERALTSGTFDVSDLAWKQDGSGLIVVGGEHPDPEHWSQRLYQLPVSAGAPARLLDTTGPLGTVAVSPDGRSVAFTGSRGLAGESASDLYVVPAAGGQPRDLTAAIDRSVQQFIWRDATTLLVLTQDGFTSRLYTVSTAGKVAPVAGFDPHAEAFDHRSGVFVYTRQTASELPEVWLRDAHAPPRQLTHLNREWQDVPLAKGELIRYTSFDGTPIEGLLLRPPGASTGKLPTITLIHGGPVGRWSDRYDPEGQLLASHGYAVFYPNIRGASSYGEHMVGMIRSRARGGSGWATGPLGDVIAGVDELVRRGVADPDRLAMGGWSYGGYMTALALSRTGRFKCGVAGAGFYDMTEDLGTEIASYVPGDEWMYGDFFDPATQRLLHEDSPITTIRNLHAPLLVLHSELDPVDTIGQAFELYRALQRQGTISQLVVYPREGHRLEARAHILDRYTRTLDWYDKYLK